MIKRSECANLAKGQENCLIYVKNHFLVLQKKKQKNNVANSRKF